MKNRIILYVLILVISLTSVELFSQVKVKGYYRKNGTYVQPHYRSNPDGNPYNNWSYPGNTNPYTGETATGNEETYLKNYYSKSQISNHNSVPIYSNYSDYSLNEFSQNEYPSINFLGVIYKFYQEQNSRDITKKVDKVIYSPNAIKYQWRLFSTSLSFLK